MFLAQLKAGARWNEVRIAETEENMIATRPQTVLKLQSQKRIKWTQATNTFSK